MFTIREVEGMGRQWELPEGGRLTIGRAPDNDIRVDDLRVSRRHAVIRSASQGVALLANVSKGNIVRVNEIDVRVDTGEALLKDGDHFAVASIRFLITLKAEPPLSYADGPLSMSTSMSPVTSGFTSLVTSTFTSGSRKVEIEELKRKAEILAQLCEMSAALAAVFDTESILEYATDVVMRAIPADCCAALLLEQSEADPRSVSLRFRDNASAQQRSISGTAVRTAIEQRVMLTSHDVLQDVKLKMSDSVVMQSISSLACAPLMGRDGVYGALYIDRRVTPEKFTDLDTQLLAAVAAQAATAVEATRAHDRLQREALARAAFARFMPEHIIKELVDNPEKFQLGGVNKRVTVLFCDVRGFTRLAQHARPDTIVDLLNILFTAIAAEIFAYHGTLNKYIGDGLMALFGAPLGGEHDAANAVSAAIAMQRRVKDVNEQLKAKNLPTVQLGIGINTGEATVGVIGAHQRSEYTAIGNTVNIASRIEGIAQPGQILVTAATARELKDTFMLDAPQAITVKHIDEPVQVFSVIYPLEEDGPTGSVTPV
ncbi:MAG TPA: adenylate/guanylate cyclase domain-containing protein [Pyrinomonadaceae bacterium]|jgi:adenylate cyclase